MTFYNTILINYKLQKRNFRKKYTNRSFSLLNIVSFGEILEIRINQILQNRLPLQKIIMRDEIKPISKSPKQLFHLKRRFPDILTRIRRTHKREVVLERLLLFNAPSLRHPDPVGLPVELNRIEFQEAEKVFPD